MEIRAWFAAAVCSGAWLFATAAPAQDTGTPTLAASDFTLTLARADGHVLTNDELDTYFSRARCACPTDLTAALAISSDAAAKLGDAIVEAQFMIGNNCSSADVTCLTAGSVRLSAASTSGEASVSTLKIFDAAAGGNCNATSTSTRFWAIALVNGSPPSSQPSLLLAVGGAGPAAPTDVTTVGADQGLLVSWSTTGNGTTLQGHQVLCAPGPSTASTASWDTCGVPASGGGADGGPFASLDPQFVCSGLVAVGTNSTRVHGLENGRTYQIAVVAVGVDGTPSAPSPVAEGTPAPTVGFGDLYGESGGTATGCAAGGPASGPGVVLVCLGGFLLLARKWRRRRRRPPIESGTLKGFPNPPAMVRGEQSSPAPHASIALLAIAGASLLARPAAAAVDENVTMAAPASPRLWNVELRFGPYRPDVDSEFAARGQSARPYEQIFSSSRHLMMQFEIDRQLSHRAGTWAAGVGIGYFNVTAAALSQDLQSRAGDETGLRLIPLSAALVYRADTLRERWGSPVVPYAKAGVDCTLWRISDTSQGNVNGRTLGWHAAAGVTLDLSPLDPEAAADMDRESGVNQTALFFEVARYALEGFGSGSALHVGDTTWFAGLMLEL